MEILKQKLSSMAEPRILDVGTGEGSFITLLKENFNGFKEIIGIDSSISAIKKASESFRDDRIRFYCMSGEDMSFEDCSMDIACISNTLHHLPDMNKTLNEMLRVLKPKGLFIINEMFCDNQTDKQMSHVLLHHLNAQMDSALGIYHTKTFTKNEIIHIAESLGINLIDIVEYGTHAEQERHTTAEQEMEDLNGWFSALEARLEQIEESTIYNNYKQELDSLKKTLYNVGMYGATELMIIGEKVKL